MNIADLLSHQAAIRPESTAIVAARGRRDRCLTFAQLDRSAQGVARLLRDSGLQPGDRVLVLQPMSAELYIALAAIFRLGLVAMFPDPSGGRSLIERCCALQPPQALIANFKGHFLRLLSPELRRIPFKFSLGFPVPVAIPLNRAIELRRAAPSRSAASDELSRVPFASNGSTFQQFNGSTDSGDPALLTFTSGSTAEPMAALRSHGFLLAQHRAIEHALELSAGEVDLSTLPIFVLANLASGVTSLLPGVDLRRPDAVDPAPLVAQIESHQATRSGASPAVFQRIVEYCETHDRTLPSLKRIFTGGGPVTPDLMDRLQRVAPHASISAVYGSTEAEPIARISRHEISSEDYDAMLHGRGLLSGRPVPSIQLRIIRDQCGTPIGPYTPNEFTAICQSPGEPGEIVVTGEHVLPGYMDGHGDQESKFNANGVRWHRTGDAGYLDHRGRLWLLGRCAGRISDAHGTLYPFSVDQIASRHPGVRRAAVVAHRGKRVLAVELVGRANGHVRLDSMLDLLAFARLDELRVLKRLPMDKRHNSKVDYPTLHALLERIA